MLTQFSWLQISDIHLREGLSEWSQKVVLQDLVRDARTRAATVSPRFIVVSGDLAWSGKPGEYRLAGAFLDELRGVFGLPRAAIFCVPGNHDIDRTTQTYCYDGVQSRLTGSHQVDEFLGNKAERENLFQRLAGYRDFEREYGATIRREFTPDGLGYVAPLDIDGLPVCVAGFNSAWLCQGGDEDERKILVGERQVIDTLRTIEALETRLVIGIVHHPIDWLKRFDGTAFDNRAMQACDILHRGHLHESELRIGAHVSGHQCVLIAAGAAFATREYENSYNICTVDIERSRCKVQTLAYLSTEGAFQPFAPREVEIQLRGSLPGTVADLAHAVRKAVPDAEYICHYLGALILNRKTEVAIPTHSEVVFAHPEMLQEAGDDRAKEVTTRFLALRNMLRVYPNDIPLADRAFAHRERIVQYVGWLRDLSKVHGGWGQELAKQENQSRAFSGPSGGKLGHLMHTIRLMDALVGEGDWTTLEALARRYVDEADSSLAGKARQMLALSLANSPETVKRDESISICESITGSERASYDDFLISFTVFRNLNRLPDARRILLEALNSFPESRAAIVEAGRALAVDTGDAELRTILDSAIAEGRATR